MEERGVLVAIAGRRDGVRVYALDEIRKAVEWRIDVELRREIEKNRKVEPKRLVVTSPNAPADNKKIKRKSASIGSLTMTPASTTPGPTRSSSTKKRSKTNPPSPMPPVPMLPPSFPPPRLIPRTSVANFHIHRQANSRGMAMSVAEAMGPQRREDHTQEEHEDDKGEWMDNRHSDDEVLVAAGPSGSAALDERTSAISAAAAEAAIMSETAGLPATVPSVRSRQRHRPTNLNLADSNDHPHRPELASPAPTLLTLRQTLNQSPPTAQTMASEQDLENEPHTPNGEVISFAEALLESRLPNAPPLGQAAAQPAPAALVTRFPLSRRNPSSHGFGGQGLPASSSMSHLGHSLYGEGTHEEDTGGIIDADNSDQEGETESAMQRPASRSGGSLRATNRRHRWSVFDGVFRPSDSARQHELRETSETDATRVGTPLTRTLSDATMRGPRSTRTPERRDSNASGNDPNAQRNGPSSFSRFFNRKSRRRERSASAAAASSPDILRPGQGVDAKGFGTASSPLPPQAPPPKLEYVKLPGTKGSVMIKAVETPKKSFLAILCGDNGEKVELFAGTYRTALGLSRTFILPDSPKTLELQLQGDDLVEVFLVFAQNVFGLEPATVRVREVRIGRAERRAARRRANRGALRVPTEDQNQGPEEDVTVTALVASSDVGHDDTNLFPNAYSRNDTAAVAPDGTLTPTRAPSVPNSATQPAFPSENPANNLPALGPPSTPHPDELANAVMLSMGPYTTFQQLAFAPPFPLATLAEECIIPPSYPAVQTYKKRYESDVPDVPTDTEERLEVTTPTHDVQWFYKDPRGIIRGPWASSLMQSWFKDNFLPPDLPVRRDTEEEYISLEELQRQSIDPSSPFRPPPPGLAIPVRRGSDLRPEGLNPLLDPVSLLTQEKRFGPPALFYSSRGGHSTSIVDARGRSVLKGRIHWTSDDQLPPHLQSLGKLGDVKRLETFETTERTIIVAFRQGGLEAVDLGDAIMTPGDGCRTIYPYFDPPIGTFNRRLNFLWRTGAPVGENVLSFKSSGSISSITDTQGPMNKAAKRRSLNPSLITGVRNSGSKGGPFGDGEEDRDGVSVTPDDLLVLGRSENNVYFCDRSSGRFRLLVLSTTARDS